MEIEESNSEKERILELVKKSLYEMGGEHVENDEMKMRICYRKKELESTFIYLFDV
jgi:hypothetical protein